MKKAILITLLALISATSFAQTKQQSKAKAKPTISPDSMIVSTAELKAIIKNYFNKVDKAAVADKLQIDQSAANEKKALADYYQHLFPEAKTDTVKKGKPIKK